MRFFNRKLGILQLLLSLMLAAYTLPAKAMDTISDERLIICMQFAYTQGYLHACEASAALGTGGSAAGSAANRAVRNEMYKPLYAAVSAGAWGSMYIGLKSMFHYLTGSRLSDPYTWVPTLVGAVTATGIQAVNQLYIPSPSASRLTGRNFGLAFAKGASVLGAALTASGITQVVMYHEGYADIGRNWIYANRNGTTDEQQRHRRMLALDNAQDAVTDSSKRLTGVMAAAMDGFGEILGKRVINDAWHKWSCYWIDWDANGGPTKAKSYNPDHLTHCQNLITNHYTVIEKMFDDALLKFNKNVAASKKLIVNYAQLYSEAGFKDFQDVVDKANNKTVNTDLGMVYFYKNSNGVVVPRETEYYLHQNQQLPIDGNG
jgi:hypothetical protein